MFSDHDHQLMSRALELARKGLFSATPNPRVGCVLVKDGQVVGEGWHRRVGEPHAEALALAQAGERARGATAYVTLEPCSHFGRTPPCARALIEARVARVIAAMEDPNPQVSGKGFAMLRSAGDPLTLTIGKGCDAIQGRRNLHAYPRPAASHSRDEAEI
jgi:diaminohydroxyphosphoribosylaminopyrimidine deaminase / 5-amino-6-(5-phosphoribosylamino)uracil reductase